jgi:hypothetical protein
MEQGAGYNLHNLVIGQFQFHCYKSRKDGGIYQTFSHFMALYFPAQDETDIDIPLFSDTL